MIEYSLVGEINDNIDKKIKENKRDYSKWRVSDSGTCYRKRFYQRQGITPTNPPDDRTLRTFEWGHKIHEYIQDIARKSKYETEIEIELKSDEIIGHFDLLIKHPDGWIMYDIKSIHERALTRVWKEGAYPHHKKQVNMYYLLFAKIRPKDALKIKSLRIIYASKNSALFTEYEVFDSNIQQELLDEYKCLQSYWDKNELPPAKPMEYWECKKGYCPYLDYCDKEIIKKEKNEKRTKN